MSPFPYRLTGQGLMMKATDRANGSNIMHIMLYEPLTDMPGFIPRI
ncbi:MAG: hypothetical protein IPJ37_07530 [Bacteroidales bacterium]|nr:hypothetical protein [Bacteroidales bacterium]